MSALTRTIPLLTPSTAARTMENSSLRGQTSDIAQLTTKLAAGDEDAFRQFHAAYFDRLLRYHLVIARGDEHAAREALQETFLRVVRHARRFDDEETFWSWLTVLARTAASDGGRKRQRYWKLLANYTRSLIYPNFAPQISDDAGARLDELLEQSLNELEQADRALIEAKYFQRASVRELALESGLTEKAVESRLLRARRELREKLLTKLRHENSH